MVNTGQFNESMMSGANAVSLFNGQLSNANFLANATTQRHEMHKEYDKALTRIARHKLVGIQDLLAKGLSYPLAGVGVTLVVREKLSDGTDAEISMSGQPTGKNDALTFSEDSVPVPVIFKDWNVSYRQKEALNRGYAGFTDTLLVEEATRKVSEKLEDMLFNGDSAITVGSSTIYGYLTYPSRNTVTLAGTGWAVVSGRDPVGDVLAMRQKLIDDKQTGPYMLYVPHTYAAALDTDYSTTKGEKTYRERILAISDIEGIKPISSLTGNNVVLVALNSSTVRLAVGQPLSNLVWTENPVFEMHRVFGIMTPVFYSDSLGNCGICHGSV